MASPSPHLLSDQDISKVSSKLPAQHLSRIAVQQLDLSKTDVDNVEHNNQVSGKPIHDKYFDCIKMWKNRKGEKGTREELYKILNEVANDALVDSTQFKFLLEPPEEESTVDQRLLGPDTGQVDSGNDTPKRTRSLPAQLFGPSAPERPRSTKSDTDTLDTQSLNGQTASNQKIVTNESTPTGPHVLGAAKVKVYDQAARLTEGMDSRGDSIPDSLLRIPQCNTTGSAILTQTFSTELESWEGTKVWRLQDGKNTVILGQKAQDPTGRGPGYYVYNSAGEKRKRLETVCRHRESQDGEVLSIVLGGSSPRSEYLVIPCRKCQKIFSLSLESGKYYLSYEISDANFGPAFLGKPGVVCLVARRSDREGVTIHLLNATSKTFTPNMSFNTRITQNVDLAVYSGLNDCFVLCASDTSAISAVSGKDGTIQWRLNTLSNVLSSAPSGLVVFPGSREEVSSEFVLVSDGTEKIRVISAQDGKLVEPASLNMCTSVMSMQCADDTLFVHTCTEKGEVAVCAYELKFISESRV